MTAKCAMLALVAITSAALSSVAPAAPNKVCPNCTDAQMYATARASGLGTLYVWNPYANGLMKKYTTYCGSPEVVTPEQQRTNQFISGATEATGVCGTAPMTTDELPVEPQYVSAAPGLATLYIASNGTWRFGADLTLDVNAIAAGKSMPSRVEVAPPYPARGLRIDTSMIPFQEYYPLPVGGKDYFTDANVRAQINQYIRMYGLVVTNSAVRTALETMGAHLDAYANFTSGVVLTYEVVFFDGSTILIKYALGDQPIYVKGSGLDGAGKVIPEGNSAQWAARWRYGSDQDRFWRDLLDLIDRYHIPVTGERERYRSMRCDWDGRTLNCVISP